MSFEITKKVWPLDCGTATKKIVLLAIADHADKHGKAWPGMPKLAEMSNLSERSVMRAVKELESKGFLVVVRKSNRANRYTVTPDRESPHHDRLSPHPDRVSREPISNPQSKKEVLNHLNHKGKPCSTVRTVRTLRTVHGEFITDVPDKSDFINYVIGIGLPKSDGEAQFRYYEANGWKIGNNPIADWKAALDSARDLGLFPSQKKEKGRPRPKLHI